MTSLYFKNFMMTAVLVIFSFLILGASFVFLGRTFTINEKKHSIDVCAVEISKTSSAFSEHDMLTSWNMRIIISTVASSTGNQIFLTDSAGYIIASSDDDASNRSLGKRIGEDFIQELQTQGELSTMTTLGNFYGGKTFYVAALPIYLWDMSTVAGYAFVGADCTKMVDAWGTTSAIFAGTAVAIMLLAIAMSFLTSKRQAEPLNEMALAARRFAHGDFSARVLNDGRQDEIGALTESFNSMAESLEKSEQLRSDFIANISHELKTPMTTIAGFADGILDGTIPKSSQDRYLETISSETKRLSRLVRQMLQMSRIQTVDTSALLSRSFNLSEVIMRTLLNFENKITDTGLDVDAQIPEEGLIVRGDVDSITQVFYNLLDNAIKFAERGSELGISLWKRDGRAFVSIKNSGDCIAPEELPFIFDRFHKTDKSRSLDRDGVGLGLSIVKTILNNHNEGITVTSRDGVTEFIFTVRLKNG